MNAPPPPVEIKDVADAIGVEALLRLLEHYAGCRIYIPATVNQGSPLARDIGLEAAQALARLRGHDDWKVPALKHWRARVYRARGMTVHEIARKLGVDRSTVQRYLNPVPSHLAQMDMFPPR